MGDLRKAAEMALKALDSCSEEEDYDGEWFNSYDEDLVREAKEALRQALAKPEWVGLTDDELNHTPVRWTMINGPGDYLLPFARAVEAKLKEKNT